MVLANLTYLDDETPKHKSVKSLMNQESITPVLNKNVKRTEPECKDSVDVATKEAKKQDIYEECTHDHTFRPSLDDVGHSIADTKVTRNRTRGRSKIVSDICHGNTVNAYEIQECYCRADSLSIILVSRKDGTQEDHLHNFV
jgi:hypothetical protein